MTWFAGETGVAARRASSMIRFRTPGERIRTASGRLLGVAATNIGHRDRVGAFNLASQQATGVLEQIGRGELGRSVLLWVPLLAGGNDSAVVQEWLRWSRHCACFLFQNPEWGEVVTCPRGAGRRAPGPVPAPHGSCSRSLPRRTRPAGSGWSPRPARHSRNASRRRAAGPPSRHCRAPSGSPRWYSCPISSGLRKS